MSIVRLGAKAIDTTDPILGQVLASTEGVSLGRRNMIHNGGMQVAQRSSNVTGVTSTNYYTIDRWQNVQSNDGTVTLSQVMDAPANTGLQLSYKVDVTTADASIAAAQYQHIQHKIEAVNLQHLMYGTANAETITLSFYVKSSKTGIYGLCCSKNDATRYDYVAEYTINAANTWERKTITIVPDSNIKASGGAIANDNGIGFRIKWILAAGTDRHGTANTWNTANPKDTTSNQVNFLDNTANEFFLTGCQLEIGTEATEFEIVPFNEELTRCKRYYQQYTRQANYAGLGVAVPWNTTNGNIPFFMEVEPRANPSVIVSNVAHFDYFAVTGTGAGGNPTGFSNAGWAGGNSMDIGFTGSGFVSARAMLVEFNNASATPTPFIALKADL